MTIYTRRFESVRGFRATYTARVVSVSFIQSGKQVSGEAAIFPICHIGDGKLRLIGTGFFITTNGLFITAKHVLLDENGEPDEGPLYVVHFYEPGKYFLRNIIRASLSTESDFAIGALAPMSSIHTGESLTNTILSLSLHVPAVGERISTYAYPETDMNYSDATTGSQSAINFVSKWYHGTVNDLLPHGTAKAPSAAIIAIMESLGGCSGGPVFSEHGDGGVIGINSAGYTDDIHVVSLTAAALSVSFFDINVGDQYYDAITIQQLIDLGHVLTA